MSILQKIKPSSPGIGSSWLLLIGVDGLRTILPIFDSNLLSVGEFADEYGNVKIHIQLKEGLEYQLKDHSLESVLTQLGIEIV